VESREWIVQNEEERGITACSCKRGSSGNEEDQALGQSFVVARPCAPGSVFVQDSANGVALSLGCICTYKRNQRRASGRTCKPCVRQTLHLIRYRLVGLLFNSSGDSILGLAMMCSFRLFLSFSFSFFQKGEKKSRIPPPPPPSLPPPYTPFQLTSSSPLPH